MMASTVDHVSGVLSLWLCNGLVTVLIFLRLGLRKWANLRFTLGDGWLAVALVFNGLRMVGDYHINEYGTPLSVALRLVTDTGSMLSNLTGQEQRELILTGKLMLVARATIVVVQWSFKMAVLDIFRSALRKTSCERQIQWFMLTVLISTFFVSLLSAFVECQDLRLNWKLFPRPYQCSYGALWINTYEISNTVADTILFLLLLVLSLRAPISKRGRVRLLIFGLAAAWILVEILRLVEGLPYTDVTLNKIVWGSIEVTVSAAVTTLPIIYALLRSVFGAQPEEPGDKINRAAPRFPRAVNITEQIDPGQEPSRHPYVWAGSTPPEAVSPNRSSGLASPDSFRNPVISSVEAGNQAGRSRLKSLRRGSPRSPRFGSRINRGNRSSDNHDALAEWVALEEVDTRSAVGNTSSPEPDFDEGRSGIFIAREINREVHQAWEADQRPRIITIPQPARLHPNAA